MPILSAIMPRYYFDVIDCGDPSTDKKGRELFDLGAVREHAFKGLSHMAKHHCRAEPFCDFRIKVRDENGKVVLVLSMQVQEGELAEPRDSRGPSELDVGSWM